MSKERTYKDNPNYYFDDRSRRWKRKERKASGISATINQSEFYYNEDSLEGTLRDVLLENSGDPNNFMAQKAVTEELMFGFGYNIDVDRSSEKVGFEKIQADVLKTDSNPTGEYALVTHSVFGKDKELASRSFLMEKGGGCL